ncbi:MAG: phosphatase PAP2 family protein [Chloroflexota bacterium]
MNIIKVNKGPSSISLRFLAYMGSLLMLMVVFSDLAEDVWFREVFAWDAPVMLAIHQLSNPFWDQAMFWITQTGEVGAILVAIIIAAWFIWHNRNKQALAILISLAGGATINTLLKLFFSRSRPALFPPLVIESGFSFPSGHVTASMAVYGFLAILLWRSRHRLWAMFALFWIGLIAVSRVYLGVHYPSDVLGAFIFSTLWLLAVIGLFDRLERRESPRNISTLSIDK